MKNLKYISLLLLFVLILSGCGNDNVSKQDSSDNKKADSVEDEKSAHDRKIFGEFSSWNLEGEAVTQEIFAEKELTMVNIWGTFCGPCIQEMPYLGEINREYADRGFQIVGMLCDVYEPGDETALQIVNATQADYQHVVASEDLAYGILSQVSAVPTTIFVDSEGNVVGDVYMGSRDKENWELVIEQMLSQIQ